MEEELKLTISKFTENKCYLVLYLSLDTFDGLLEYGLEELFLLYLPRGSYLEPLSERF